LVSRESRGCAKTASQDGFELIWLSISESFVGMIRDRAIQTREKLVSRLPVTGELLRGSLLERTIWHRKGCPKCARGEGHHVFVLTVSYGGGRTRQISVRGERVAEVRRWLNNYQKLKGAIEAICEFNHELLRPPPHRRRSGDRHD
jgi:hypothetical protein